MNYLINLINREPIRFAALIRAIILCAIGFGLKVTPEQLVLVMVMIEALFAILTRQQVTPNLNVENRVNKIVADFNEKKDDFNDPKV